MLIGNKVFPYPLLRDKDNNYDYKNSQFYFDFERDNDAPIIINGNLILRNIFFYLDNPELKKLYEDGAVKVYIQIGDHKEEIMTWEYKNVEINTNVVGPTLRYQLPHIEDADTVQIILECGEYSSKYTMLYRLPAKPVNAPRKMNAVLDENVVE